MLAALKVINDSLHKTNNHETNLKNANRIVQREWFRLSSTDNANPLDVEDYLDCFEEFSNHLLKYMVNLADTNVMLHVDLRRRECVNDCPISSFRREIVPCITLFHMLISILYPYCWILRFAM